jgi:hypothetical protein
MNVGNHLCCAAFTMFIAITFPFLGRLLSFLGGFTFALTTYSITFPFFGGLLSFFGGFIFTLTTSSTSSCQSINWSVHRKLNKKLRAHQISLTFVRQLPCIMWLAIYKPRRFGFASHGLLNG